MCKHYCDQAVFGFQVSEESAEAWVDEFATAGPDFQQAKAAVEVKTKKTNTL